ncbi:hypothetical protein IGI04_018840 [Brassica rapa subsp. trilocularis]|uniref:Mediator of RNA polymerase II transcription subunit 9 n=1 Tax=Brassica rapa subsp. trilocularis TaxID=1813537 RepID=A0ABQ7MHK0_BRACM|nr:hypothetical protein IGI04_018840 [Brassica rapa subsp. trilocularis]
MLISLCFVAVYTSYAPRMNHIKLLARIHGYPVIHLSQRKPKRVTNGDVEDSTVISPRRCEVNGVRDREKTSLDRKRKKMKWGVSLDTCQLLDAQRTRRRTYRLIRVPYMLVVDGPQKKRVTKPTAKPIVINLLQPQQSSLQSSPPPQTVVHTSQSMMHTPQQQQSLASHFHLYPLVEKLTDAIETGTRDDALQVTELNSHFDKCQQLLNSISGSKTMTVDGQKRNLEESEQLLQERRVLMVEYRNSIEDLLKMEP